MDAGGGVKQEARTETPGAPEQEQPTDSKGIWLLRHEGEIQNLDQAGACRYLKGPVRVN